MKNKKEIIILLLFVASVIIWILQVGGIVNEILENSIYLISVAISVLASGLATKYYGLGSKHGKAFLLFTLALVSWFVGESLWVTFDLLNIKFSPSIADIFYILAYPLFATGIYSEIRMAGIKFTSLSPKLYAGIACVSLILISSVFYFSIIIGYDPTASFFSNIITIGYGFGDLLLVVPTLFLLVVAREYKGGKLSLPWFFIFGGIFSILIADVLFAVFINEYSESIYPFESIELFWIAGYLLISIGFLRISSLLKEIQNRVL